ncbi:hypothetical protein KAU11_08840 [Candidatus Babeliales bacterium]|nr:hypothetical protein [Candidatus Babeliales bacterium]
MTRWELMKEAWKGREPVSTSEIVSGIRAGTIKALQPAVRAGEQFREARPDIAERISRTPAASQIRASVQLRKDIDTAKRQVVSSEKSIVLLKTKIDKAPVRDGVFTGTDKQFLQHERDVKAYNTNITQINASNKRIAALEGKKFIPKIERAVSSHIPTLADISRKGAQFRVKYPEAAAKIYSTFQAAHVKTERVGTQSQREALAGYTYGSYSSLQKQPVKIAASFAIGGASVKAMRMVGLVGKAYGAGKWSKRMGKAAQYGIILYYGKKSSEYIMSAPNARVAGERAAKIMYTEILPMAAGIKAVEVAPKVARVVIKRGKLTAKEFEVGSRQLLKDTEAKTHMSFGKTKKQKLEDAIKSMKKKKGEDLTDSEIKTLEKTFGTKRLRTAEEIHKSRQAERKAEAAEIKRKIARGELKEVKVGTGAQQQIQLVEVKVKPLTKQSLKEVVKLKEQFELKIDKKAKLKLEQEAKQRALAKEKEAKLKLEQKFESVLKEEQRLATQAKQKLLAHEREMIALADAMPSFKRISKVKQIQKVKVVTKTEQKVITRLAQKQKQVMTTATRTKTAVKTATKTAQKVKTEVRTATKAKVKTKAQQKTKLAALIALQRATQTDVQLLTKALAQLKAATKEVQEIKPAVAMVTATTTKTRTLTDLDTLKRIVRESIAEEKAAARELTRAIRAVEALKFKVPPIIPIKKIPTKKKITKRQREMMVLKQKNLNAVATFKDLLGGL